MGQKPPLFEPGYDDGVELFLHCLGWGCVSRSNHSGCLENCGSIDQYSAVVDDSTGVAADSTGDAKRGERGIAGRPRLCRWQVDEVLAGESELAFPHPDQTLVPVSTSRSMAQGFIGATANRTRLLHLNCVNW